MRHADTYEAAVSAGAILTQVCATGGVDYWTRNEALPEWATAIPAPAIPDVSAWQFIQALDEAGFLTAVEAYVVAATDPMVAYGWSRASTFSRHDPFVLAAQATLGMSDAQADALFLLAASK